MFLIKLEENICERAEWDTREPSGTTPPWLLKNTYFCYDGEQPSNNDEKKCFFQYKEKQKYQRSLERWVKEHRKEGRNPKKDKKYVIIQIVRALCSPLNTKKEITQY